MGLQSLERRLERMVEGVFRRSRGSIRPIELGRRLVREMDDNRTVDVKGRRMVPNDFVVLLSLAMGDVDLGLLLTTYFGYWLTGLAMISIGLVASFLTRNLTIGFILGLIFNMPLVFMKMADVLPSKVNLPLLSNLNLSRVVSNWSIAAQFDSFGRGVVSLSSVVYFLMIIVVGLYLSMMPVSYTHLTLPTITE